MIDVKENEDGSFTIEWDSEDPYESIFNDFTAKDFEDLIEQYCQEVLSKEKYIRNKNGLNFNAKQVQQSNYEGYTQTEEEFYGSKDTANSRKEFAETGSISEATQEDWNDFWELPPLQEGGFPTEDDRLWEG